MFEGNSLRTRTIRDNPKSSIFQLRGPTNPIYLFYEEVLKNAHGIEGNMGDKHYKCYHGQRKILTITKAMRSSLNGGCYVLAS
jgi:hypothetical protein